MSDTKHENYEILNLIGYGLAKFDMNFVKQFGVYPICNNKTGFEILNNTLTTDFKIDWDYFK